jgi:HEAT repeat protein
MLRIQGYPLLLAGSLLLFSAGARAQPQQAPPRPAPTAPAAVAPAAPAPTSEPKITVPGVEGDYLRSLHTRIHYRFANKFIEDVAAKRPKTDPLNNPTLRTEVNFGVRWDGTVTDAVVAEKSGVPAFDQAATAAVRGDNAKYPTPPVELFGDDGVAHFSWVFARNNGLCGVGAVRRIEAPLAQALPRLFIQGRYKEALMRAARDSRAGSPEAMTTFALAWLQRPQGDQIAEARAAAALFRYGDKKARAKAVERLKPALRRKDTLAIVAPALGAAASATPTDFDAAAVCDLIGAKAISQGEPEQRELALLALRDARIHLPAESPCAAALNALVVDTAAPVALRALAIDTLVAGGTPPPAKVLRESMEDRDPLVRAAAVTAFGKPGGGRPALYRLQPLLQDPVPDVRAAVAAAILRACGDVALPFVQPMFKEKDDRALLAMAPELGRMKSPESADLLAKMMARPGPQLRLAVTRALVDRKDDKGRALRTTALEAIRRDSYPSAELRAILYAESTPDELLKQSRDPVVGPLAFKALLRAKRHGEATDWLTTQFDRLPPETTIDVLAAWLANPPPPSAAVTTPGKRSG